MTKPKRYPLQAIVYANVEKWRRLKGISGEQIAGVLGVKKLSEREKSGFMTVEELDRLCQYLELEPEKLLER